MFRFGPRVSLRMLILFVSLFPVLLAFLFRTYFFPQPLLMPTDAEVIQAVMDSGQTVPPTPYRIVKERHADYLDPPRVHPSFGQAQLHHVQFMCSVIAQDSAIAPVVVYFEKKELWKAK